MPAPTLQAQGTIAAVTTGNLAITLPAYQADDIVVITSVGWVPNTTTGTNTMSLASPWTKYSPDQTLITSSLIDGEWALWWARATSNSSLGTTVTITRPTSWDTGTDTCWGGRAYVVRGCVTTGDPWDAVTAGSLQTAANAAFPGVSYTDGNNLVIQFLASSDNQASGAAPSGWTAGTEAASTTGTDCMFQTFRQTFSISGSGTSTASTSATGAPAQGRYIFFGASFTPPVVTRTASDSATSSESTQSNFFTTLSRTASDSATSSETAIGAIAVARTATADGTSTESTTTAFFSVFARTATADGTSTESTTTAFFSVFARTATADGVATESTTTNVIGGSIQRTASAAGTASESTVSNRFAVITQTASASGTASESTVSNRFAVITRTASAAGTSTATADDQQLHTETGSASGSSTETATGVVIRLRTATATGVATESTTTSFFSILSRTATADGAATESTTTSFFSIFSRTATADGVATESTTTSFFSTVSRTATADGTSTATADGALFEVRTATADGTSTATADWDYTRARTGTALGEAGQQTVLFKRLFRAGIAAGVGSDTVNGISPLGNIDNAVIIIPNNNTITVNQLVNEAARILVDNQVSVSESTVTVTERDSAVTIMQA